MSKILTQDQVENCAEIWASRNAIMNGVKIENMVMKTVNFYDEDFSFAKPCNNCVITFFELVLSGRLFK